MPVVTHVLFAAVAQCPSSTMHDGGGLAPDLLRVQVAFVLLGVRAGGWDSAGRGKPAAVRRGGRLLPLCQILPSA